MGVEATLIEEKRVDVEGTGCDGERRKPESESVARLSADRILAVAFGRPHSGLVRLVGMSAREQGPICAEILDRYGEELAGGAIVTVEPGRVRIRPAVKKDAAEEPTT